MSLTTDVILKIIYALCAGTTNQNKCVDEYLICLSGEIEIQALVDCVQMNIYENKCEWLLAATEGSQGATRKRNVTQ